MLCIWETLDWRPDILRCVFGRNWTRDQISCVVYSEGTVLEIRYPMLCILETLGWRPDILRYIFERPWAGDQISCVVYSTDTGQETRYPMLYIRQTLDWRPNSLCCIFDIHCTGDQISWLSLFGYSSAQVNVGTVSHIKRRPTAFTSLAINCHIFSTLHNDIVDKKKPSTNSKILIFHLCLVELCSSLMLSSVQAKMLFIFFIYEHLHIM